MGFVYVACHKGMQNETEKETHKNYNIWFQCESIPFSFQHCIPTSAQFNMCLVNKMVLHFFVDIFQAFFPVFCSFQFWNLPWTDSFSENNFLKKKELIFYSIFFDVKIEKKIEIYIFFHRFFFIHSIIRSIKYGFLYRCCISIRFILFKTAKQPNKLEIQKK